MKKRIIILAIAMACLTPEIIKSQGGTAGNNSTTGGVLGWTAGPASPLQIRNNFLNQPISFFTTNAQRVTILGNINPLGTGNSGFVGFNNANPTFNIDGITRNGIPVSFPGPNGGGGHLFLRFRPQNFLTNNPANENEMGLWNFSGNAFAPTFFGHVNSTQTMPGIVLLGAIDNAQDVAPTVNANPVHQFRIGKNLNINLTTLTNISEVNNRVAYAWYNGATIKMMMNAAGQLRIGTSLAVPTITANLPGNRLEVTSAAMDPGAGNVANPGGSSGIRTTNMTSATPTTTNPGNGVVSVNSAGDFIYVPGGGTNFGNACGSATPNPLPSNWEIPMNNFNLMFNDNTLGGVSRIGFGFLANTCAPTSNPKFAVENASYNVGGGFNTVFNPVGGGYVVGVVGRAQTNSGIAIGSQGIGRATAGANVAIGVHGSATTTTAPRNIGVHGEASGAVNGNVGVFGQASGGVNGNIGIYGQAPITTVQTPSATPAGQDFAGFFNGDVVRTGTDNFTSDATLKTNIDTIQNISAIISALKPRSFNYTNAAHPQMNLTNIKQYGFIAQDVETILPELVMVTTFPAILDSLGNVIYPAFTYKTLNYQALHAFSIKAIQELTKKVNKQDSINNALQSQIAALTSSVSSCCSSSAVRTTNAEELNQLNINLSNNDVIVLNQNVPNPFAEQTTITYNVPEKYGYAQIIFSTIDGRILKTVDITKKGRGQLNVFANDLGNGLYTYSLVVDGKVIDTKKMVKGE